MRRILIFVVASTVLVMAVILAVNYKNILPQPENRTSTDFTKAIIKTNPRLFLENGDPIFSITETKKPMKGWYILKIKEDQAKSNGVTSIIVIEDPVFDAEKMKVVSGPVSAYSKRELNELDIPNVVKETLR